MQDANQMDRPVHARPGYFEALQNIGLGTGRRRTSARQQILEQMVLNAEQSVTIDDILDGVSDRLPPTERHVVEAAVKRNPAAEAMLSAVHAAAVASSGQAQHRH